MIIEPIDVRNRISLVLLTLLSFGLLWVDTGNFTDPHHRLTFYIFASLNTVMMLRGLADVYAFFASKGDVKNSPAVLQAALNSGSYLLGTGVILWLIVERVITL